MTKITDTIRIEVEMTAPEALRSMVVLGRTNGAGNGDVWKALREKLDPKRIWTSAGSVADIIGIINYASVQADVNRSFFGLYCERERSEKLAKIQMLQTEIDQLKKEIGE